MKIHQLAVEDALRAVRSGRDGLTSAEARRRLQEYGHNRVEKVARQPAVLRLAAEFTQFFSVILWIAAALAFVAEWHDPGQGMARIGTAIIVVIVVSGLFSFWQEYRIERTLGALRQLLPQQAKVLRDGSLLLLPTEELAVGDVILFDPGDSVAADCRLIEGRGVRVNTATVTGESVSRALQAGPSTSDELLRSNNVLLAGTSVVAGEARAVVFATGGLTEFGRIAHLTQTGGTATSPLRRQLAYLSRLIAVLSVAIGALFFALGVAIGLPFWQDFIFAIGIIVAMVPEGLPPTLTLALMLAAQRMAKRNVLIRHLTSVETLGSATVICTDKTGTLTENRMRVGDLLLGGTCCARAALASQPAIVAAHRGLFLGAALCHDLKLSQAEGRRLLLGDPMEVALLEMAQEELPEPPGWQRIDEISFDGDRMCQSVVHAAPDGPMLFCKGAPEVVLARCSFTHDRGTTRPLDDAARELIVGAQEAMADRGLRVLAFASRRLPQDCPRHALERELVFDGLVGLEDPPRPEVPEAIGRCRAAGIRVIMVTGDHPRTAVAIARAIGLVAGGEPEVITGEQLRRLSDVSLLLALDLPEVIFARAGADQKLRIVEALKRKKHVVAVTGDGVNDAPALNAAHIGIAMGMAGTDVAKQAAHMVLLDDNFASIVNAIEEGRAVFQNIRKFITYVLVHNVAQLIPYLAFALFRIPLPLTPIQVLSVDMGTDTLTALGLGIERPEPEAMTRPPRPQNERLLSLPVALRAYLFLGLIEAVVAMAAFFLVLWDGGWTCGERLAFDDPLYLRATTACLSAIIVLQIVNVFLCRSARRSVFSMPLLDNRLIVWGVALELVLLLTFNYAPLANALLGTAPVPPQVWLFLVPAAAAMLLLEEGRKWLASAFGAPARLTRLTGINAPGCAEIQVHKRSEGETP